MSKNHTQGAPAPTINQIHNDLLRLSLAIGAFADMPEDIRREIAETVAMLREPVGTLRAAELADLIAINWDAAASEEVDQ
ncbi:MAG: hypothetical protein D6720_07160 [Gammaproteobacteria bacterium]|nr:MAG: hypothetical protein D6720_07160 [Gammaproteobacteria bacterium]